MKRSYVKLEIWQLKQKFNDAYTMILGEEDGGGFRLCGPKMVPGTGWKLGAEFFLNNPRSLMELRKACEKALGDQDENSST